jgi:hypothetical protein
LVNMCYQNAAVHPHSIGLRRCTRHRDRTWQTPKVCSVCGAYVHSKGSQRAKQGSESLLSFTFCLSCVLPCDIHGVSIRHCAVTYGGGEREVVGEDVAKV